MIVQNLKIHYQKTLAITFTVSLITAFLLYLPFDFLFFGIQNGSRRFLRYIFMIITAVALYINQKFLHPYYFYKTLKCPKCQRQYFRAFLGTSVRLELLNEVACQSCKYHGHFDF